jgi:hypothetical protein
MTLNGQVQEIQIHCPVCGTVFYGDRELARHLTKAHGEPMASAGTVALHCESAAIRSRAVRNGRPALARE